MRNVKKRMGLRQLLSELRRKDFKEVENSEKEIKTLPIQMSEKRELLDHCREIKNFGLEEGQEHLHAERIYFFKLRLFWELVLYRISEYEMWKDSLHEIEIQRGTMAANVFYFIRNTIFYNLILCLIVFLGIGIPQLLLGVNHSVEDSGTCVPVRTDLIGAGEPPFNVTYYDNDQIALCCWQEQLRKAKGKAETDVAWYAHLAMVLGGSDSLLTTPLVFGHYGAHYTTASSYPHWHSFLYVLTTLTVLGYSFAVMVRNITKGLQYIVRTKDGEMSQFSQLIFCGHFGRSKTKREAHFRRALWLNNLRIAIKQVNYWGGNPPVKGLTLFFTRVAVFILCLALIAGTSWGLDKVSDYCLITVSKNQGNSESQVFFRIVFNFIPSITLAIANILLPVVFLRLGKFESYKPNVGTILILYRTLGVRLISVFIPIMTLFKNMNCVEPESGTCTFCPRTNKEKLPCWESSLGLVFYKMILIELVVKTLITMLLNPIRRAIKRCFYGFAVTRKIGTIKFNVNRQSIDVISGQVVCWIGFYFAPAFPIVFCIYLVFSFYIKKYAVLHNVTETPPAFRASRTTTIYESGKLIAFILVLVFVVFLLGHIDSSRGCGPFPIYRATWDSVELFLGFHSNGFMAFIYRNVISSQSVYIPLIFITIAVFNYFLVLKRGVRGQSESLKDLMYLENQDRNYLAHNLMQLRYARQNKTYFNLNSIYDSEKWFTSYFHPRLKLERQWEDLRKAVLPVQNEFTPGELTKKMQLFREKFSMDNPPPPPRTSEVKNGRKSRDGKTGTDGRKSTLHSIVSGVKLFVPHKSVESLEEFPEGRKRFVWDKPPKLKVPKKNKRRASRNDEVRKPYSGMDEVSVPSSSGTDALSSAQGKRFVWDKSPKREKAKVRTANNKKAPSTVHPHDSKGSPHASKSFAGFSGIHSGSTVQSSPQSPPQGFQSKTQGEGKQFGSSSGKENHPEESKRQSDEKKQR